MDTLHDRLAALADDAPTGGAPAAQLWARGRRAHRVRTTALAATLLVVLGTVGAAIGGQLVGGDDDRSNLASAGAVDIELPIDYPLGEPETLPDLGLRPGPLAAIWVTPRVLGRGLEAVGLVAETGAFGVLAIDAHYGAYEGGDVGIALSPDGRRLAHATMEGGLTVRDLVSGEKHSLAFDGFEPRMGDTWIDATHLAGHVAGGSDVDGWVWEPGTVPERVDLRTHPGSPWLGPHAGIEPWFHVRDHGSACSSPTVHESGKAVLCDALGVIGPGIVLTHWGDEVVALDRADSPFQGSPRRRVVVTAGAPDRVVFATALIGELLDADDGAS